MYAYWKHVYAYAYVCMHVHSRLICVCIGFVCEFNGVNHMHVYACVRMYMSAWIFTSCLRTSKKHDRIHVLLVWIQGIWNMGIRPHCSDLWNSVSICTPVYIMMTSSNGNIFRVTGPLCREFTGEFPPQWPVTRSFDIFFDLCLIKRLSKPSWGWWFETPPRALWRHCNV